MHKPNNITKWILVAAIINGLIIKYLIFRKLNLNSDTVYLIWLSKEFWNYQNYLLNDCYLNSASNYLFTEWIPFLLGPQILSDFDPSIVRTISFVIYFLVIFIFSFLIFIASNNVTNSLIFAAIMANLNLGASIYYLSPVFHIGTLFFTGVLLLLFTKILDNEDSSSIMPRVSFIILLNLGIFSDSILVVWFIIPALLYYILIQYPKIRKLNMFILLSILSTSITYLIKTRFIHNFNNIPLTISPQILDINLNYYFKGMLFLLTGDDKLTPVVLLIISAYVIVILTLLKFYFNHTNVKYNIIYCMLLIGFLVTLFLATSFQV